MKFPRRIKNFGFTLLEIMVAIALLVLIVVAIYGSWNAILKGTTVALKAAAEAQRSRITTRTLHDSLLCACMFSANATNYEFIADSDSEFSSLSFVARLPRSFPRSGRFGDFVVRRLTFSVTSGSDGKELILKQNPLIMNTDKAEEANPLVLARDVTKFLVEYVDPKTGDWVTQWDATNQLPKEIRITVGIGHADQFSTHPEDETVNFVAIPEVAVLPQWQAGQPGGGGPVNRNQANPNTVGNPANPTQTTTQPTQSPFQR